MKKLRLLIIIPAFLLAFASPVSRMNAMAVKVDIIDNYDGNKLGQESDSEEEKRMEQEEEDEENGVTSSSASTASSAAATRASSAASTAATTASSAASSAASVTPAASTTASTAAATASTTTNDLPRTGDDDRIFLTLVIMAASFSVFLTALLGEKFGKNH